MIELLSYWHFTTGGEAKNHHGCNQTGPAPVAGLATVQGSMFQLLAFTSRAEVLRISSWEMPSNFNRPSGRARPRPSPALTAWPLDGARGEPDPSPGG